MYCILEFPLVRNQTAYNSRSSNVYLLVDIDNHQQQGESELLYMRNESHAFQVQLYY
jgi:hypothetical protein